MPFSEGTICFTHTDTPHSERWSADGDVWCLIFDIEEDQRLPEGLYYDQDADIFPLIEAFFRERQTNRCGRDEISLSYLELIIALMARLESQPSQQLPLPKDRLDDIYHYIQDYYMTDIAFDELAISIGYSYDRFRHLFKERYHVSPKQMVMAKRMALAKQLLRESEEKIESIAYACGFGSPSQFNVIFKKYRGMTPKEYRKKKGKKKQA